MQDSSDYEKQREARILENQLLLASLGLDMLDTFSGPEQGKKRSSPSQSSKKRETITELRRSLRAEGSPVSYEFYTSFKDITFRNYIKKGRSEFADSCHQCRTKSDLKKVQCTAIRKYTGMRCSFKWDKSCLLKYNQKLNVALNNPKWRCPVCEGRCDCSRCRIKRGLRPYGNSWRIIRCTDTDDEDEDISGDKSVSIECNEDGNKAQAALFVTKPIVRERRKTAIYNRKYNFSRSIEVPKENSMDHSKKATYSLKKETRPLKILIKNSLKLDSILDQKMKDLTMKISQ